MIKTHCYLTLALILSLFVSAGYAQKPLPSWQPYTGAGYSAGIILKDKLVTEAFSIGTQWIYNDRYIGGLGFQRSFFQEERRTSHYTGYSFITFTADVRVLPSKENGGLFLSGRAGIGLDDTAPFLVQAGVRYGGKYRNSFVDLNTYVGWSDGDQTMLSLGVGYWFDLKTLTKKR